MALSSGGIWLASLFFLAMASSPAEGSPGYVVCYYSSWAHYRKGLAKYTVEDIPVDLCTHLIYAFATLDSKTYLAKPFDTWLDVDLKNYEKFVKLKEKNPKMKVLLGVGGWNDSRSTKYSIMVADASKRRKFVKEVVKLLLEYGFDGLDLDWEYPGYESKREDKEGFTLWVEDLKTALSPHGLLLTTAVSASRNVIDRGYDIPKIMELLDFVNLMAYDFHGSWERVVAHHSPLYPEQGQNPQFNADFAVNYWIKKGAPVHKIVLGVPLYGRSWTLAGSSNSPGSPASGAGRAGKYIKERGHMAYYECCLAHQEDGWTKITGDGGPYLTKGDQWVGYDDIEAVVKKAQYARDKGLGGIMVWDTVSDDFNNACGQGPNPLLTAIFRTLQGNPPSITHSSGSSSQPPKDPPSNNDLRPSAWNRAYPWKQPDSRTTGFTGVGNVIGEISSTKGSSGSGGSQNNDLPYEWLAWPIFSDGQQNTQNIQSNVGSQFVTRPPVSSSTRFSFSSNNLGDGSGVTTKPPYDWLSWPIFSSSSVSITPPSVSLTTSRFSNKGSSSTGPGQTTKQYYDWQSWPIFNNNVNNDKNDQSNTGSQSIKPSAPSVSSTTLQISDKGSVATDSGQTNKQYDWQSWPIFSNTQQANQNHQSNSGSQSVTFPPSVSTTPFRLSTTSRFSSTQGGTIDSGSKGSSVSSGQTTKAHYDWQSWPLFNTVNNDKKDQSNTGSHSVKPSTPSISSTTLQPSISGQTNKQYDWQLWPIFNNAQQGDQNTQSDSGSPSVTSSPSVSTTTSRFSSRQGATTNQGSRASEVGSELTKKARYDWQSWPVFNESPVGSQGSLSSGSGSSSFNGTPPQTTTNQSPFSTQSRFSIRSQETTTKQTSRLGGSSSQTTKPHYEWLSWPVFSNSPENSYNSISTNTRAGSLTTSRKSTSSFSNLSSLGSKFSSASSAANWFDDCKSVGFAPDPESCSSFYRCTDNHAYRFDCPGGLLWRQDESSCDWPNAVQCILPVSKPNIAPFIASKSLSV